MGEVGAGEVGEAAQGLLAPDLEEGEEAALDVGEEEEQPDAEGDVPVQEEGEAEEAEVELRREGGAVDQGEQNAVAAECPHVGQPGEIGVQRVQGADGEGEREAGPHHLAAEERLEERAPPLPVLSDQGEWHLDEGVRQPLVLHPLPADDHHQADRNPVHREDEQAPPEDRFDPGVPGNAPLRVPFVEPLYGLAVGRDEPVGQVGDEAVAPPVFPGRVEAHPGDDRQQVLGKADRRYRRGQHRHDVDGGELGGAELPGAFHEAEEDVDHPDEEEEGKDRGRGVEVVAEQSALDDHVAVRERHPDPQAQGGPDDRRAQGDAAAFQALSVTTEEVGGVVGGDFLFHVSSRRAGRGCGRGGLRCVSEHPPPSRWRHAKGQNFTDP